MLYWGELWTCNWEWVWLWVRSWVGVCGILGALSVEGKFILMSLFSNFLFELGVYGNILFSSLLTEMELRTLDDFCRDKLFSLDLDWEFSFVKLLPFSYPSSITVPLATNIGIFFLEELLFIFTEFISYLLVSGSLFILLRVLIVLISCVLLDLDFILLKAWDEWDFFN